MIDELFTEQTLASVRDRIDNPSRLVPARKESVWGAITAVPRAVTEAVAQRSAGIFEAVAGFGSVLGAYPEMLGPVTLTDEQRRQADAQRERLLAQGPDVETEIGRSLRNAGAIYRPDPATASTAEQVLYGFARGATKIVTAAPAGLPGFVMAGAEEAASASDDLAAQGVPQGARMAAGAVQGAGLALAALPLVGTTLPQTAALYVAGGPGGFMAQQALTREILRNAGQDKVAEQFDPFDPVGLSISALLPAGFTAYGLRAQRMQRAAASLPPTLAEARGEVSPVPVEPAAPPEPIPSARTAVADAVQRYGDTQQFPPEVVDAAMAMNIAEQARGADAGAQLLSHHENLAAAVARAHDLETQLAELEARRADLLPIAGNLAEPGEIRDARTELRLMEQTRVDLSDAALRALAKVVQARDGISYKAALSQATKDAEGRAADWTARQERLQSFIDDNAKAQQATQSLHHIDQQMADLRSQAETTQPAVRWVRALVAAASEARQRAQFQRFYEATAPAKEAALTPTDGAVRMYHGGSPEGVTGPLWFTSDLRDAMGWASRGAGMQVWYVDVPKAIADSILGGDLPNGIVPLSRAELPPELANQRRPLVDAPIKASADAALTTEPAQPGPRLREMTDAERAAAQGVVVDLRKRVALLARLRECMA